MGLFGKGGLERACWCMTEGLGACELCDHGMALVVVECPVSFTHRCLLAMLGRRFSTPERRPACPAQSQPNDFRGFLAKGLLLREQGRQADAQRAFIQARYLAPKETRPVVDGIINRQQ